MNSELERPFEGVGPDSIAGGAIGLAFGGPAGAAAGALTPVVARMVKLAQKELSSQGLRAAAMWTIAAREANVDPLDLLDRAESEEVRMHLGYTAADAAVRSRYSARIVALGRALANGIGASDDAELDHWQLIVDALSEVDRPHLVVLSRFADIDDSIDEPVFVGRTLDWQQVKKLNAEYGASISALLARLERLGLLHAEDVAVLSEEDGRPGDEERLGAHWRLSNFGYLVLDELWRAGGSTEVVR
ncbi:hypothetical protein [Nocardioides albus]|uniref:Uncharacterized protein n=1 Tax=Nocardioides albus TaxID=1841 RepID=A0A7W5FBI2_9ACTN|nr:hypothetical protein [Nocardioides albus]MBB3092245.1 hypothetical protein [Nocardioides albus]GGU46765.1 hypothetical protein GCM10007979_52420 [Nocardioides albus]